jgi:rhodanese-related sulfurtransferase
MFNDAALAAMEIDGAELQRRIESGDNTGALVDVRETVELGRGMLPGAVNMPMSEFDRHAGELDKAREIICYCEHGVRSLSVAAYLASLGFRARSLRGGFAAWKGAVTDHPV